MEEHSLFEQGSKLGVEDFGQGLSRHQVFAFCGVVQRLRFGDAGFTCCLDHLGEDGPECMTEGTIIYINRDHPLYRREPKKREAHVLTIARLITQEISLMKDPQHPREAYNRQSKLLRDAFKGGDDKPAGRKERK